MEFFSKEIEQTLKHLTSERIAAIEAIQATIAQERKLATEDLKSYGTNLVDHAFMRAAQLGGAALIIWMIMARLGAFARPVPKM